MLSLIVVDGCSGEVTGMRRGITQETCYYVFRENRWAPGARSALGCQVRWRHKVPRDSSLQALLAARCLELVYILPSRQYSHTTPSIVIQHIQQSKMTLHDPLDLLKTSLQSSNPPQLLTAASEPAPTLALAAYLSFTSIANPINLPKDTPTRYTSKPGSTSEFYNIGQLYLAWVEKDSGVRDYLIKGQAGGVGYVAITDRRPAVDYLLGKGDGEGRIVAKGEEGASKLAYACIRLVN